MEFYKFVRPIQTDIFITSIFTEFKGECLTVNVFILNNDQVLIIDENQNRQIVNLTQYNINWNMVCASVVLGKHCIDVIKQFYPEKEVTFLKANSFSSNGHNAIEPDYFLFYGLK